MALVPAVTDLEQLKNHPAVACLLGWNTAAVEGVKFDRDEMTIYLERGSIREACALLKEDPACPFNFLSDVTCVDWYPAEPRFEVVYHLLSIPNKERVRLKVRLNSSSPVIESLTSVWPGRTTLSARSLICSECGSRDILIYGVSSCRRIGKATRCARIIRWRATARKRRWPT
jgi:hypothetical protein